jgi:hypothetical protein
MGRTLAAVSSITPQEHSHDTNTGQTSSNDCFSNNAPELTMTVTSRNLQVITDRAAREGARERVCFAQKPVGAAKMALWATQQPRRGGTTSCASRPSAGIDRAKCLISLMPTVKRMLILCTVTLERAAALISGHTLACGPRRGRGIWIMSLGAGPLSLILLPDFFGDAENVGPL